MNYLKENKLLFIKYLLIIISNVLLYILTSYYFRNSEYSSIIMFVLIVIVGMIVYSYKEKKQFRIYFDIMCCFILGIIMMFFIKNPVEYSYYLFNMFFANNIVFIQSKKSEKVFIRGLQYLSIILVTILCMFFNLLVFYFITF